MTIILDKSQEQAVKLTTDWYFKDKPELRIGGVAGSGKSTCVKFAIDGISNAIKKKAEDQRLKDLTNPTSAGVLETLGISLNNTNTSLFTSFNVVYAAYTGKAALELRKKGHNASTLHSLLYDVETRKDEKTGKKSLVFKLRPQESFKWIDLIVVDEASMVTNEIYNDLMSLGIKILFLGDHAQLEAPFDNMGLMQNADCYLDKVHRYAGIIAQICDAARHGRRIAFGKHGTDVAKIRWNDLQTAHFLKVDQVICNTHKNRKMINEIMRESLNRTGLYPVEGEKLICLKNNSENGLVNGLFCTALTSVDPTFDVNMNNHTLKLNVESELGFSLENLLCDASIFNEKLKESENYNEYSMFEYDSFDFGYAITTYKSQGSQFGKIMVVDDVFGNEDTRRKSRYTAYSRAQNKLIIVDPY